MTLPLPVLLLLLLLLLSIRDIFSSAPSEAPSPVVPTWAKEAVILATVTTEMEAGEYDGQKGAQKGGLGRMRLRGGEGHRRPRDMLSAPKWPRG